MRLAVTVANELVDGLGRLLSDGSLQIFDAGSGPFHEPLVSIPLGLPAFPVAEDGRTSRAGLSPVVIDRTGEATRASLVTGTGQVVADLVVRSMHAPDAKDADVLVERTDFHRGGLCTISVVSLQLPLGPR